VVCLANHPTAMTHGRDQRTPAQTPAAPAKRPAHLPRIHLASQSPRRRELLAAAGISFDASHPGIDDALLAPGPVSPEQWVMALAYLKASSALRALSCPNPAPNPNLHLPASPPLAPSIILGADTVVLHDDRLLGQPTDAADARRMLLAMRDATHEVVTGVAILDPSTGRRELFADRATVRVGHIPDDEIDRYIASGEWRGKAGAYNLVERLSASWPITYDGDPGTIMGLPMRKLLERLPNFTS